MVAFEPGEAGAGPRLNGTLGVCLPAGLITQLRVHGVLLDQSAVITPFTTSFFGAVNERMDGAGFPFSTQWLSMVPQSWDGNTMLWSGSDQWLDGSAGLRIQPNQWRHLAFTREQGRRLGVHRRRATIQRRHIAGFLQHPARHIRAGRELLGPALQWTDRRAQGVRGQRSRARRSRPWTSITCPTAELLASAASLLDLGDVTAVRENLRLPRSGAYATGRQLAVVESRGAEQSRQGDPTRAHRTRCPCDPDRHAAARRSANHSKLRCSRSSRWRRRWPWPAYRFEDNLRRPAARTRPAWSPAPAIFEAGGSVSYAAGAVGRALVLTAAAACACPTTWSDDHNYSISMWLNPHGRHAVHDRILRPGHGLQLDQPGASRTGGLQNTMLWSGTPWFDGTFNSPDPDWQRGHTWSWS